MRLLENDIIKLRAVEPSDLDTLFRWENDSSLWSVGCTIAPFSRKQLWDYIENYTADIYAARQLRLMVERKDDNSVIGTVDLYEFDPFNSRAYIGILIDNKYGRQGYGTQVLHLIQQYAGEYIGLHQLAAIVPENNQASLSLFKKCGYELSGHLRSWLKIGTQYHDAYIFQLILD